MKRLGERRGVLLDSVYMLLHPLLQLTRTQKPRAHLDANY
jgi:hypothetical protein